MHSQHVDNSHVAWQRQSAPAVMRSA